jgi:hypothetical protein
MNDDEIGRLSRDGVPPRGDRYWDDIHRALADVDRERQADPVSPTTPENPDIDADVIRLTGMHNDDLHSPQSRPAYGRMLAVAAALILIVGIGVVAAQRDDPAPIDVTNDGSTPPATDPQTTDPVTPDTTPDTTPATGDSTTSVPSTTTTVAIDPVPTDTVPVRSPADLLIDFADTWRAGDWEAMAELATDAVVTEAKIWFDGGDGPLISAENIDAILASCTGDATAASGCEFLFAPNEGFGLIFSAAYATDDTGALRLTELRFQGDAG